MMKTTSTTRRRKKKSRLSNNAAGGISLKSNGTSSGGSSKSTMMIKIKPFSKPPTLPPNFYESSVEILWKSLDCLLHQRQTQKQQGDVVGGGQPKISMVELCGKVQDLCQHSYGPRLYSDLVRVLEESAKVCVKRLLSASNPNANAATGTGGAMDEDMKGVGPTAITSTDNIAYPSSNCHITKDGWVYFQNYNNSTTSISNTASGNKNTHEATLKIQNILSMWSDYVQYLNCVRSVFLSMDRMFVYYLPTVTGTPSQEGIAVPIGSVGTSAAGSSTTSEQAGKNSMNTSSPLTLWDVGMHCIWKHLVKQQEEPSLSPSATITLQQQPMNTQCSVLEELKSCTISCLLAELDSSSHGYNNINNNGMMLHKSLLRNCVSIFRTLGQYSTMSLTTPPPAAAAAVAAATTTTSSSNNSNSTTNILDDFLHDLVQAMTQCFTTESRKWMQNDPTSISASTGTTSQTLSPNGPTKTGYDARAFLHHAQKRLKQVQIMTMHYLLAIPSSSSSSTSSSSNTSSTTRAPQSIKATTTTNKNEYKNNVLTHLVEQYLLTPHFTSQYILHPANLYPILDEDLNNGEKILKLADVKLLYSLSKRVMVGSNTTKSSSALSPEVAVGGSKGLAMAGRGGGLSTLGGPPTNANVDGHELLRMAFVTYGREQGASIVRMRSNAISSSSSSAVKPTSISMSHSPKDSQSKVITNLLRFKAHLEFLYREAFGKDESFGKTVRTIMEDVVNDGGVDSNNSSMDDTTAVKSTAFRRQTRNKSSRTGSTDNSFAADGGKRIAELLAKHVDSRFRNAKVSLMTNSVSFNANSPTSSGSTARMMPTSLPSLESHGEAYQIAAMDLFQHIQSKDVFEAFYRRDLAKRLLLQRSTSIDSERLFVSKLKAECGGGYTSKMEGMFKDMDLSRDVMGNYSAYLSGIENDNLASPKFSRRVQMDVTVLTTGYWPAYPQYPNLILPDSLQAQRKQFEDHYKGKYQGRRIAWQNSLGHCIVVGHFPKISKERELHVSLCQALVLLCFNDEEMPEGGSGGDGDIIKRLTIFDVMKKSGLTDRGEAERILQSLSLGRDGTQVLRKVDHDDLGETSQVKPSLKKKAKKVRKTVNDTDVFMFNSDFTNNQHRIKINNIQMKETAEDRSKTHEAVTRDRAHIIDAVVVRIMKARKTLSHTDLIGEVMNQLKFPAGGADIKLRIESLIERDYLERQEKDRSRYNYLA